MNNLRIKLAKTIKRCRNYNGYTQEKMAKMMGCGKFYISNLESGNHPIGLKAIENICKVLNIRMSEFFILMENENDNK